MSSNVIVFGWNRSLPGRERLSGQHFQDFTAYLQSRKDEGAIDSFEPVLLEPHGGTVNGFFLIKAPADKLAALAASSDWVQHQTRAMLHLEGSGVWRGVVGSAVGERMGLWMQAIPT